MKALNLVTVNDFCMYHNVEDTLINSLEQAGLVKVTIVDETTFIPDTEIRKLEKIISLYQLDINLAGIEAITHLLIRMEQLQENMRMLHNKLDMYEAD